MEIAFLVAIVLLVLFAILGMYDGFYLHIFKYKLYQHAESKGEHITHTIRALLFPAILYFLYLRNDAFGFYLGLIFLGIDVAVTIIDAYVEKDSRTFMGGLPRGEYIIHLLVNGFHFAAIAVFLLIKIRLSDSGFTLINNHETIPFYNSFIWLVENLIPGAIVMALIHLFVAIPPLAKYWNHYRSKISCC
jgi:hypothetical protein